MKIEFRKGYILLVAPIIIVRDISVVNPQLINHELIHFRQEVELLLVGSFLLYFFEYLYGKLIKKLSATEAYFNLAMEQEAYLNQNNLNYLNERKPFAVFHYLFHKNSEVRPREIFT
jgi:hypothetical protein